MDNNRFYKKEYTIGIDYDGYDVKLNTDDLYNIKVDDTKLFERLNIAYGNKEYYTIWHLANEFSVHVTITRTTPESETQDITLLLERLSEKIVNKLTEIYIKREKEYKRVVNPLNNHYLVQKYNHLLNNSEKTMKIYENNVNVAEYLLSTEQIKDVITQNEYYKKYMKRFKQRFPDVEENLLFYMFSQDIKDYIMSDTNTTLKNNIFLKTVLNVPSEWKKYYKQLLKHNIYAELDEQNEDILLYLRFTKKQYEHLKQKQKTDSINERFFKNDMNKYDEFSDTYIIKYLDKLQLPQDMITERLKNFLTKKVNEYKFLKNHKLYDTFLQLEELKRKFENETDEIESTVIVREYNKLYETKLKDNKSRYLYTKHCYLKYMFNNIYKFIEIDKIENGQEIEYNKINIHKEDIEKYDKLQEKIKHEFAHTEYNDIDFFSDFLCISVKDLVDYLDIQALSVEKLDRFNDVSDIRKNFKLFDITNDTIIEKLREMGDITTDISKRLNNYKLDYVRRGKIKDKLYIKDKKYKKMFNSKKFANIVQSLDDRIKELKNIKKNDIADVMFDKAILKIPCITLNDIVCECERYKKYGIVSKDSVKYITKSENNDLPVDVDYLIFITAQGVKTLFRYAILMNYITYSDTITKEYVNDVVNDYENMYKKTELVFTNAISNVRLFDKCFIKSNEQFKNKKTNYNKTGYSKFIKKDLLYKDIFNMDFNQNFTERLSRLKLLSNFTLFSVNLNEITRKTKDDLKESYYLMNATTDTFDIYKKHKFIKKVWLNGYIDNEKEMFATLKQQLERI